MRQPKSPGNRLPIPLEPSLRSKHGTALVAVFLPPGTERVAIREIPGLVADAIHPPLPEGTPRLLIKIRKEATSPDLAAAWCGHGNNFPVSLTSGDWDALNKGAWRDLEPLSRKLNGEDDTWILADPLPEPDWEPYRLAFESCPPPDWRLIAEWRNAVVEQWLMSHEAQKAWKQLLAQQALHGSIAPRSRESLIPRIGLVGSELEDSFLTPQEFSDFAAKFGIEVHIGQSDPTADDRSHPESAVQRQDRRLARLRELGGQMRRVPGAWNVDVANGRRGALAKLVREEKTAQRVRSDRKDVTTDLAAAAERERLSGVL